jgi:small-conductance mechanosensitive channel
MVNNWHDKFELLKKDVIDYIPRLVISILIFIIFVVVANYYKSYFTNNYINSEETKSKSLLLNEIGKIVYYLIIIAGVICTLINLGFNIAIILTFASIFGLAFGLALQGTFINIISGIILSVNNLYEINDTIKINILGNNNYTYGKVVDFNLYFTTLYNQDTNLIINIPNSQIHTHILNINKS